MAEYEELRRALDKKDLNRFIEKLPIYDKEREIYSFCYHYEELYNESMGVKCDTMPEDILFRADMAESKRTALVDLIVTYLSEPTQTRKAKNDKGFTVQTTAQKSVIALLKKSECLHPTIDIFNATELHHITSLFIEQKIGVGNVSYSSKYNEAEIFQNYNPNKLDPVTTEYRRYQRFKEFEEGFKRILG
ncbi:MAG: hypothetical protein SNH07_00560 [Rikenellaceae bacterium]